MVRSEIMALGPKVTSIKHNKLQQCLKYYQRILGTMPSTIYSYYMNDLIQSLPSPSAYSGGITHTWMRESWMVDGDALVMMMAMISSKSPSRQGARTEFLVPGIGFHVVAVERTSFSLNF